MSTPARHRDPATQRRVVLRDAELLRELALGLFTLSLLSNTCASPSRPAEVVSVGDLAFVILTRSIHAATIQQRSPSRRHPPLITPSEFVLITRGHISPTGFRTRHFKQSFYEKLSILPDS